MVESKENYKFDRAVKVLSQQQTGENKYYGLRLIQQQNKNFSLQGKKENFKTDPGILRKQRLHCGYK